MNKKLSAVAVTVGLLLEGGNSSLSPETERPIIGTRSHAELQLSAETTDTTIALELGKTALYEQTMPVRPTPVENIVEQILVPELESHGLEEVKVFPPQTDTFTYLGVTTNGELGSVFSVRPDDPVQPTKVVVSPAYAGMIPAIKDSESEDMFRSVGKNETPTFVHAESASFEEVVVFLEEDETTHPSSASPEVNADQPATNAAVNFMKRQNSKMLRPYGANKTKDNR